jgi:uncharacterized protein (DUF1800 family)
MSFDTRLAEIRFGTGLSPRVAAPGDASQMLERLAGPDQAALNFPVRGFDAHLSLIAAYTQTRRGMRDLKGPAKTEKRDEMRLMRKDATRAGLEEFRMVLARGVSTQDGFRERLVSFWADHFTAVPDGGLTAPSILGYQEDAIRPYVTGRFADLLKAAVTHPLMLVYLDQDRSTGPGSRAGRNGKRGLNENLAREVLELHTLGVDGPYSQADVRQLAELFTGMSVRLSDGFVFKSRMAEPGAETVLGKTYGGDGASVDAIFAALDDLALHPATARHLAGKLAAHFVADVPAPKLVDHVAGAYLRSDGDLIATYGALLEHPFAWMPDRTKARQPYDFLVAALRALAVPNDQLTGLRPGLVRRAFLRPMTAMGQTFSRPPGPDGWPEAAAHWITPQGLAARIEWSMKAPEALLPALPDPREFVEHALGGLAGADLQFAVSAAETRADGVAMVLISPEFQRR